MDKAIVDKLLEVFDELSEKHKRNNFILVPQEFLIYLMRHAITNNTIHPSWFIKFYKYNYNDINEKCDEYVIKDLNEYIDAYIRLTPGKNKNLAHAEEWVEFKEWLENKNNKGE